MSSEWAFQGLEKMSFVFLSFLVTGALQFFSVYIFVKRPEDLFKIPILYFAATLPVVFIFLWRLGFRFRIDREAFKRIWGYMGSSLTIWGISIFAQAYNTFDLFALGFLRSIKEVGYFTIARRFVGSVALLMIFLTNAALPRFSSAFCSDKSEFAVAVSRFMKLIAALTVFVLVPVILFSDFLVSGIFGAEYLPASLQLKLMIAGIIFVIFNLPYSTALIACGMEKEVLKQVIASAALNVLCNLMLIPNYGMTGASVSFIIAEMLALVWIVVVYRKKVVPKISP
jgi:PST family polysaccharide transporter